MINEKEQNIKKYRAEVKKKLDAFRYAKEWSDFISLLSSVDTTIKAYKYDFVPKTKMICKRLAQCLNPALPAGVHSKALETYAFVFGKFSREKLLTNFQIITFGFFSSASDIKTFSCKQYLDIIRKFILPLGRDLERYTMNVLIGLLPFLESETNEFFPEAVRILEKFRHEVHKKVFYFSMWQCFYALPDVRMSVVTFVQKCCSAKDVRHLCGSEDMAVQSICAALDDMQITVLRGTLDILLLIRPFTKSRLKAQSVSKLTIAVLKLFLRGDVSVNKRVDVLLGIATKEDHRAPPVAICEPLSRLLEGDEKDISLFYRIVGILSDRDIFSSSLAEALCMPGLLKVYMLTRPRVQRHSATTTIAAEEKKTEKIDYVRYARKFYEVLDQDMVWQMVLTELAKCRNMDTEEQSRRESIVTAENATTPAIESEDVAQPDPADPENIGAAVDALSIDVKDDEKANLLKAEVVDGDAKENGPGKDVQGEEKTQSYDTYEMLCHKLRSPDVFLCLMDYVFGDLIALGDKSKETYIPRVILALLKNHSQFRIAALVSFLGKYSDKTDIVTEQGSWDVNSESHPGTQGDEYEGMSISESICRCVQKMLDIDDFEALCELMKIAVDNYRFMEQTPIGFWARFCKHLLTRSHSEKLASLPLLAKVKTEALDPVPLFHNIFDDMSADACECLLKLDAVFKGGFERLLFLEVANIESDSTLLERFTSLFVLVFNHYKSPERTMLSVMIYLNSKIMELGKESLVFSRFIKVFSQIHNNAYVVDFVIQTIRSLHIGTVKAESSEVISFDDLTNKKTKNLPLCTYADYPQTNVIEGALVLFSCFIEYSRSFCEHIASYKAEGNPRNEMLDILFLLAMTGMPQNTFHMSVDRIQYKSLRIICEMIDKKAVPRSDILHYDLSNFARFLELKDSPSLVLFSARILEFCLFTNDVALYSFIVDYFSKPLAVHMEIVKMTFNIEDKAHQFRVFRNVMNSVNDVSYTRIVSVMVRYIVYNATKYTSDDLFFTVERAVSFLHKVHSDCMSHVHSESTTSDVFYRPSPRSVGEEKDLALFSSKILGTLIEKKAQLLVDALLLYPPYPLFARRFSSMDTIYVAVLNRILARDSSLLTYLTKLNSLYTKQDLVVLFDKIKPIMVQMFVANKSKCDANHYTYLLRMMLRTGVEPQHAEFLQKAFENLVLFMQKCVTRGSDAQQPVLVGLYGLLIECFDSFPEKSHSTQTLQMLFHMFFQVFTSKTDTAYYQPTITFFSRLVAEEAYAKYWTKEFYELLQDVRFFNEDKETLKMKMGVMKVFVKLEHAKFTDILSKLDQGFFVSREVETQNKVQVLKRASFFMLCGDVDQFLSFCPRIFEKMHELLSHTYQVRKHTYLLVRVMVLKIKHLRLKNLWPIIFNEIFKAFEEAAVTRDFTLIYEVLKFLDILFVLNTQETAEYHPVFIAKPLVANDLISVRYGERPSLEVRTVENTSLGENPVEKPAQDSDSTDENDAHTFFERLSSRISTRYAGIDLCVPGKRAPLLPVHKDIPNHRLKVYLDAAPLYYLHLNINAQALDTEAITKTILDDLLE